MEHSRNCSNCIHSWTNSMHAGNLVCSHPESGHFGLYIDQAKREHCGQRLRHWEHINGDQPKPKRGIVAWIRRLFNGS